MYEHVQNNKLSPHEPKQERPGSRSVDAWKSFEPQEAYMREVGRFELLSAEEERALAKKYAEAKHKMREILFEFPAFLMSRLQQVLNDKLEEYKQKDGKTLELEEINLQKQDDEIAEMLKWAGEQSVNLKRWRQTGPAMDIFRNEFLRRFNALEMKDDFFDESAQQLCEENQATGDELLLLKKLQKARELSLEAKLSLVQANLRLVISIAKKYAGGLLPLPDLIQEGNLGLMRAVESYDYSLGYRLSTYSTYWIRQAMSKALASQGRAIRIPINTLRLLSKIKQCEQSLLQKNGVLPEHHEIAAKLHISGARVSALLKMAQQPISLQSLRYEDQDWEETLADKKTVQPYEQIDFNALKDTVNSALNTLDDKEKEVLQRRFGLNDQEAETLEQIGQRLNLSSERIRQIEAAALRKLRDPEKNKFFAGYE